MSEEDDLADLVAASVEEIDMDHYDGLEWFVDKPYQDEYGHNIYSIGPVEDHEQYEETVCEVWDVNHPGEQYAHLIAAAPQMYTAIQKTIDFIHREYYDPRAAALEGSPLAAEARPIMELLTTALQKVYDYRKTEDREQTEDSVDQSSDDE